MVSFSLSFIVNVVVIIDKISIFTCVYTKTKRVSYYIYALQPRFMSYISIITKDTFYYYKYYSHTHALIILLSLTLSLFNLLLYSYKYFKYKQTRNILF